MSNIMSYLFETNAVRFCPDNQPFWYTSGKIGPYFINTHFLYGSEKDAVNLLDYINSLLANSDKELIPGEVYKKVLDQYQNNSIYKTVIDEMKSFIEENINLAEVDYISGGERRDWFFSIIIAHLLNKPHITIFKDLKTVISNSNFDTVENYNSLNGKKVLHIADLVTEASSYIRAWIPAIKDLCAAICWSTVVVDRMQGGSKKLEAENIEAYSMIQIDPLLFNTALEMNIINESQVAMLNKFFENPDETMRNFLLEHPEFLENALKADEKTAKRAQLCIDSNLYNL